MKKAAIIMGSDSDLNQVEKAVQTLKDFNVPFEVHVYSAHRTPREAEAFAPPQGIRLRGYNSGGREGSPPCRSDSCKHHPAGYSIPLKSSALDGLDALLSTVQMPAGVPVATVAIDGSSMQLCWLCRYWLFPMRGLRTSLRLTGSCGG